MTNHKALSSAIVTTSMATKAPLGVVLCCLVPAYLHCECAHAGHADVTHVVWWHAVQVCWCNLAGETACRGEGSRFAQLSTPAGS